MAEVTDENFHEATFEPIEETPTETQEPVEKTVEEVKEPTETQEPVKDAHFQKIAEERLVKLYQEQQARERLEKENQELKQKFAESQKPVEEEVLVEPVPPSDGDSTENYLEQIKYAKEMAIYNKKVNDRLQKAYNAEIQARQYAEKAQAHRQYWIGEFMKEGATLEKANKAYDKFAKQETVTAKNLLLLLDIDEGTYKPTTVTKKVLQTQITPPGVDTGGENEPLKSPDDEFNKQLGQANKYKL